ncbi:MAG TPA: hypothetical protein VJL29_11585 [Thermoguttaceae bacterium]|nr:hypothetical protein [Thermoguttaceae bacterium]
MDKIERQVRRAQRRLGVQRFVAVLGWTCTAALGVAIVLVLVGRFWSLGVPVWAWPAAAVALGFIAAWAWTIATRADRLDAAVELDRRFGLKERVSSSLALSDDERHSPPGQALVNDATRRVERINVADQLRVQPSRPLLYPLIPGVIVLLLIVLVGPARPSRSAQANANRANVQKQVKKTAKKLEKKLAEQRKKAERQGLKEVKDVLRLVQQDLKKLQQAPPSDRKKALMKLNDLAKQVQEQRDRLGGAERLKDKFRQLNNLKKGPADLLADAMKQGDLGKAMEELKKLQQELASDKLDEAQRKQMADQLKQMAEKLEKIAKAHQKTREKLEQEIQKRRDAGDLEKANKLEEQLAKLQQQMPQMNMMEKLSDQLGKCSKCCNEGQPGEAGEAMRQLAENLGEMQQQMDQVEMLDEAMDQMAQCRGQMCGDDDGDGDGESEWMLVEVNKSGHGLKAGYGHLPGGAHGKEADATFHNSQVRSSDVRKGSMTVAGYLDGPNRKDAVGEAIHEQFEAVKQGQADPLTDQQMPKSHRQNAQEYLERLREGK